MIKEHHIQQLKNDLFVGQVYLNEVSGATYIEPSLLLDNEGFRALLASYVTRCDLPFSEACSNLIKYANENF